MAASLIFLIEILRIAYAHLLHHQRNAPSVITQQQMNMVFHQAIGKDRDACLNAKPAQYGQVEQVIIPLFKNRLASDAAYNHMKIAAFAELARLSGHDPHPFSGIHSIHNISHVIC